MSEGPGQDPGGGPDSGPPPGSSQELSDLKDQFEQQQLMIAQLKAMLRKNEQSNVTQEKVEEYMNTLSKRRAKKGKKEDEGSKKLVDNPTSQKVNLLRQQVEENKARLAERGKSQKGIEEMVTQLKAQLDDSQHLISQSSLNVSLQDTQVEYSENSSAQELYVVLLNKEKRISDLLAKVQKLESNVLDLQENVREKDSVIDARTKAITLMTENLSKKRKSTLDILDETKEQMRKMQENFVTMEAEMKTRQMKLLEDLKLKNYEIAELQEVNGSLEKQIGELREMRQLGEGDSDKEVVALRAENFRLSETITQKDDLIKKLEECLSELKAKEDEGSENEEISKLRKQLDESNKNMIKVKAQHKSKVKELTKKIETFKKMSDVNAEIVKLESENSRLNQKIAELEEEKGNLQLKLVESDSTKGSEPTERETELESLIQDHVRSLEEKDKVISILEADITCAKTEIDSLNEKLNSLSHLENAQVTSEMASIQFEEQMERLENEKKELLTENEEINKEKEQLLETIEQLKKEKQEMSTKMEHYIQENIELIDKLEKLSAEKVSSAESIEIVEGLTSQEKLELEAYQKNLDIVAGNLKASEENLPQVDLNESVNELTEETSELLQKIELFTVERREVMEKMEQLKQENLNLNLKIKEIENNRDILAETYEQLQSEKEALDAKLENVETENASLKEKMKEVVQEKVEERVEAHSSTLRELEEEIGNYKNMLEEKRIELEDLNALVQNLQFQLDERNRENNQLNNTIIEINRTLADLENDNKSLQMKVDQLEEQKTNLSQLIEKNQEKLEAVNNTEWENRRLLESKENEIIKLMKERDNSEGQIADLQRAIKEKEEKFHNITSDLKNKYLSLQKQLEDNSSNFHTITAPLEAKIEELTTKNKEQLEKMKKIAANLKKKTQANQELEEKFKEAQARHETELNTSLKQLQELEVEVSRLQQQLGDKREDVRSLEEKNVDLQNIITDLRMKADKSNEVSLQQELLLTKENLGSVENSLRSKIQELEMIIETQESELTRTRERVNKLEEGISFVEERRSSLERKATELGAQLEEKSMTCEEMSVSEDMLEKRLAALTAHDEAIERKLEEAVSENSELNQQNQKLIEKNLKLKNKIEQMRERIQATEGQDKIVEELEAQNEKLKKQIHHLENELKHLQNEYDRMLEENRDDFDRINKDWQTQFDEVFKERTELMVKCEKFAEELKEISEKEFGFNSELIEYKTKLENSESEIKKYEERIQQLTNEREEIDHLKKIIAEKEAEIERLGQNKVPTSLASFFDTAQKNENQQTAQVAVEPAITQAETFQQNIPTFVWSGQTEDPFDFIQSTPQEASCNFEIAPHETPFQATESVNLNVVPEENRPQGNTTQELLEKIKTLEFMLYSMEKEKDDAVMQGHQLSNELTRLVYERENSYSGPIGLESQILQESEIRDDADTCKELQKLEFEETKPAVVSTLETGPVVEEVMEAKETYQCFVDENESQAHGEIRQELRNTFGENDDGWGWGPEEAKLEEEHAQKNENVESLKDRIRVLEIERENHVEEIKQLQIKSGKLIKKLKEFKVKNEELAQRKKSECDMFSLDDTIQEELKLQIQQVEKKLKETSAELMKEKNEKTAILKRIDVLTAANERMVEMKEKQDIELLGWQQNYKELNAKLERFEWGDDGFSTSERPPPPEKSTEKNNESLEALRRKVEELNETIKDLTMDNDELQDLLEEQRKLRVEAETKSTVPVDYSESLKYRDALNEQLKLTSLEKEELIKDKEGLSDQLRLSGEEKKQLQDQINELIQKNTELEKKFEIVEKQKAELDGLIANKEETIMRHNQTISDLEKEKAYIARELEEKDLQIASLQGSLEGEKDQLFRELQEKNAQIESFKSLIETQSSIEKEKEVLFRELQEKNAQIESMRDSVDSKIASLKLELDNQTQIAQTLLEEKLLLTESLSGKDSEIVKLTAAMEQMTQEWDLRIDQRGNDVAESWKLHLESRETEFAQIEQLLRKEINELEEKTNALVNENNELRKNVDAEIRNEVDRVAALQQQINDRQQYINDLTRTLQEKQGEVDSLQLDLQTTRKNLEDEKSIVDSVLEAGQRLFGYTVERNGTSVMKIFEEREDLVVSLQKELEDIRLKLSQLSEEHSNTLEEVRRLNGLLDERNETLTILTSQLQEMQNLKDYENENVQNLQQNLIEYQQINSNINAQLQMKSAHLEDKDRELATLRQALEEKEREKEYALENLSQQFRSSIHDQSQEIETLKRRLADDEHRYEELLQCKDSDLEGAHLELTNQIRVTADKNREIGEIASKLSAKIEECNSLQQKIDEQNLLLEDESKQLTELKAIIEEQVLKIEELKKDLFEKSNDYDSLIAEMDISRISVKDSETLPPRAKVEESEDLSEPVSRAELDLALYMLHQRDVRCEELTVELTQLLEERDTLQLRLSNVIREKEELVRRVQLDEDVQPGSSNTGTVPKVKPVEEAVEALDSLTTKLSELKTVGYRKDKNLVDEQELRRLQQLSIMQQHRDVASRLPPEAAARLVDASYTLSRDVQSPSKVLLNWLWGRSTPRVNNI